MKKKPPRRKPPHDISAAWFVIPMSIAAAVLIARGNQRMDISFLPASRQAVPAAAPVVEPAQPGLEVGHAKAAF